MRKILIFIFLVACLHFSSLAILPQKANNILTNEHVVEMVKAGIPEATIILAIQHSDTKFDTSTETLTGLKKLGVSQKVLEAMLNPQPPESVSPNEIILFDGEKRISMQRGQMDSRYVPPFPIFGKSKTYRTFEGIQAKLRVSDTTPEFEVSVPSDVDVTDLFVVVKLKQKSDRREIKFNSATYYKSTNGFDKDEIVPTMFEEVKTYSVDSGKKYKLYRVKVVNPLPPGEYAFAPRNWYYVLYDFGID